MTNTELDTSFAGGFNEVTYYSGQSTFGNGVVKSKLASSLLSTD